MFPRRPFTLCVLAFAIAASAVSACQVPVFRYALERWDPSPYELILFTSGPATPEIERRLEELRRLASFRSTQANLNIAHADTTRPAEFSPRIRQAFETAGSPAIEHFALLFPFESGSKVSFYLPARTNDLAWHGPATDANFALILDSPLRRQIASRLLKGSSVVYLFLPTGETDCDTAALDRFRQQLDTVQKLITLPVLSDQDRADYLSPSGPPLNKETTLLTLDPDAEPLLTALLLAQEEGLTRANGPHIFPIFGQGRSLGAINPTHQHESYHHEVLRFLTGPCSCQAKQLNPGTDLLLSINWRAFLDGSLTHEQLPPAPQ